MEAASLEPRPLPHRPRNGSNKGCLQRCECTGVPDGCVSWRGMLLCICLQEYSILKFSKWDCLKKTDWAPTSERALAASQLRMESVAWTWRICQVIFDSRFMQTFKYAVLVDKIALVKAISRDFFLQDGHCHASSERNIEFESGGRLKLVSCMVGHKQERLSKCHPSQEEYHGPHWGLSKEDKAGKKDPDVLQDLCEV